MIGGRIVEIDGPFDEPQAEIPRVEAEIPDGIAGNGCDVMKS
jgi:hypothetical protein